MSKSSKKKRRLAKKKELEKLRGMSVLDKEASPIKPLGSTPDPLSSKHRISFAKPTSSADSTSGANNKSDGITELQKSSTLSSQRKQIEFVLPRKNGIAKEYLFDIQAKDHTLNLSAIPENESFGGEESGTKGRTKNNETIDEILFPSKRRKLADKFEAVHRAEETKIAANHENSKNTDTESKADTPPAPVKQHKKKRRRSGSLDGEGGTEMLSAPAGAATRRICPSNGSSLLVNRQLSGRSVEQAVKDKSGLRPRANSTDGELNLPQRGLCDEQMVLQSHKWQDGHAFVHNSIPRGLNNLGNTCFLNSTLQCLAHSPPFCQSLVEISKMKARQAKYGVKPKQSPGQRLTTSLCNLFQRVHGLTDSSFMERSISPQVIVNMLPTLGSIGSRNGYKFWPGRQEDSHEFLVHLLDAMHDGELRGAGINQHLSGWRDRLPVTRLDETTFIHRIFGGYFRSQVRCKICGYCSNTYDPFLDLSLEVSKKSSRSLMSAISEFTRKETLDFNNQWKCSGCKKYVCPSKQLTVFRAPLCLCIQLKRFAFDGGFGDFSGRSSFGSTASFSGRSKISKPIEFPVDLSLPLSDGRSCSYSLTGVVIHVGGSASSGHYTAYVKKPAKNGKSQWYHIDDSFVEAVSEATVLRQKDAYILFYCRKEVKLEFPSLPPRDMSAEEAKEFGRARARARSDSGGCAEVVKTFLPQLTKDDERSSSGGGPPAVHPLLASLNKSMSEHFQKGTSPAKKVPEQEGQKSSKVSMSLPDDESSESGSDSSSSATSSTNEVETKEIKTGSLASSKSDSSSDSSLDESAGRAESPSTNESHAVPVASTSSSVGDSSPSTTEVETEKIKTGSLASSRSDSSSDSSSDESVRRAESPSTNESHAVPVASPSSSDGDSSDSSVEANNVASEVRMAPSTPKKLDALNVGHTPNDGTKTRVVVESSDSRGKVKVMVGPRKRKAWVSKTKTTTSKGSEFQLLGNLGVSKWDDGDQDNSASQKVHDSPSKTNTGRDAIVSKIEKQEKSRKRRMHSDRWDAFLDQGRTKKVKKALEPSAVHSFNNPKKNAFQKISAGIQSMNKGRAKGFFRTKGKNSQGSRKRNTIR